MKKLVYLLALAATLLVGCQFDEPKEEVVDLRNLPPLGEYPPVSVFDPSQAIVTIPAVGGEVTVQYSKGGPWPIMSSQRDIEIPMRTVDFNGKNSCCYSVQLNTVDFSSKESFNYDGTVGCVAKEIVAKAKEAGTRDISKNYSPKNEDEKKYPVRWSEDWAQLKCSPLEVVINAPANTTGKDRKVIVLFSNTMGTPYNNLLTIIQSPQ